MAHSKATSIEIVILAIGQFHRCCCGSMAHLDNRMDQPVRRTFLCCCRAYLFHRNGVDAYTAARLPQSVSGQSDERQLAQDMAVRAAHGSHAA